MNSDKQAINDSPDSPSKAFPALGNDNLKIALVDGSKQFSYAQLNRRIDQFAIGLLAGQNDLNEARIAFLMPASLDYVTTLFGIWRAGGIAIPLNVAAAEAELDHYLNSAGVTQVIANAKYQAPIRALCARLHIKLLSVEDVLNDEPGNLPKIDDNRRAIIVFTSGTTNKPKGVVSTHHTLRAQITTLLKAWAWNENDIIPLFLPLHHIHGIINILCCGLWAGATVHLFARFDIANISRQVAINTYTVFMAVPTIYVKLIQYLDGIEHADAQNICAGFKCMRLNVSGSAACPVKVFEQWQALTGQILLERYGMTEIGMALSNSYRGERRAGYVGLPLSGVTVQLFDEDNKPITGENQAGEIRVKGDNVFLEYWGGLEATQESFIDGWFCSGDIAVVEKGYYRIMGRSSIDIIKSGGYKLSALEIENTLLNHESILEVAVIGVEDEVWGEVVTAFIVLNAGARLEYQDLKTWCDKRMSSYKTPRTIKIVNTLPRNAMGKVIKPKLPALLK